MKAFATIVTRSHLSHAYALLRSISRYDSDAELNVLVVDSELDLSHSQTRFFRLSDLSHEMAKSLIKRYSTSMDKLRWVLKSVFLIELLKKHEKVIYLDADIAFFRSASFLFEELDSCSFLLTRHHRPTNPPDETSTPEYQHQFGWNFRDGFFNAGFIGVNPEAIPILEWWAKACTFSCEKNPIMGIYDDQKYLDLLPYLFDNVGVVRHLGCNLAEWNRLELNRELIQGEVLINRTWPVVFIHFSKNTIEKIMNGEDPLLRPFLDEYLGFLPKNEKISFLAKIARFGSQFLIEPLRGD